MKVVIVNAIVYTSEVESIKRAESIKDSMIYDLCLAFQQSGHDVTLIAAEPFKPCGNETYPFSVEWLPCKLTSLFKPFRIPFMPQLFHFLKKHRDEIDLVISSEVFSLCSLIAAGAVKSKLIIWHELAKHNAMMKKIPSKVWYNVIAPLTMGKIPVIARSEEARAFIGCYCRHTLPMVIDHGVNLEKFAECEEKDDHFVVCSQLIARKRIDGILQKFQRFLDESKTDTKLYIIGDGDERKKLEQKAEELQLSKHVYFLGKLQHSQLLQYLSRAKALLVNTEKDNSMISIVESIAVGTPVITTCVPLNASYIKKYSLGIVCEWDEKHLLEVYQHYPQYVKNCLEYRKELSTLRKVEQFISAKGQMGAL